MISGESLTRRILVKKQWGRKEGGKGERLGNASPQKSLMAKWCLSNMKCTVMIWRS